MLGPLKKSYNEQQIKELVEIAKTIQIKKFDETRKQIFDIRKVIRAES